MVALVGHPKSIQKSISENNGLVSYNQIQIGVFTIIYTMNSADVSLTTLKLSETSLLRKYFQDKVSVFPILCDSPGSIEKLDVSSP